VIGANMQCKLFVALQLEVAHHFIERCARGRARRLEPPATFGTPKTAKALLFNPHQFPSHSHLFRRAPMLSDHMPGRGGKFVRETGAVYMRQFWMVCRASYTYGRPPVCAHPISGSRLKSRHRVSVGSDFVRLGAVSIAQSQGRMQLSVDRSSD